MSNTPGNHPKSPTPVSAVPEPRFGESEKEVNGQWVRVNRQGEVVKVLGTFTTRKTYGG